MHGQRVKVRPPRVDCIPSPRRGSLRDVTEKIVRPRYQFNPESPQRNLQRLDRLVSWRRSLSSHDRAQHTACATTVVGISMTWSCDSRRGARLGGRAELMEIGKPLCSAAELARLT